MTLRARRSPGGRTARRGAVPAAAGPHARADGAGGADLRHRSAFLDLSADCPARRSCQPHRRAGGTRTPNLRFWRPVLCQLSHCPSPVTDLSVGSTPGVASPGLTGLPVTARSQRCTPPRRRVYGVRPLPGRTGDGEPRPDAHDGRREVTCEDGSVSTCHYRRQRRRHPRPGASRRASAHRRVRDPRRRRQGQGAQGRRPAGDRFRRRRARLPDP